MKLSLIQYPLTEHLSFEQFCEKMRLSLRENADLHLFPELHSAELMSSSARTESLEKTDWLAVANRFEDYSGFVSSLAREKKTCIVGGTFPRVVGDQIRNTCVIATPEGKLVLQDKLFPTYIERHAWQWAGGGEIVPFLHLGYRIISLVCYDSEFPQVSEALVRLRPHVVLVPSCTSTHFGYHRVRWCAQARAIEHFAYVASTGTVGSLAACPSFRQNEGQAYVLSPSDEGFPRIVAEGPMNQAAQLLADVDLAKLEKDRSTTKCYPARDQTSRSSEISMRGIQ